MLACTLRRIIVYRWCNVSSSYGAPQPETWWIGFSFLVKRPIFARPLSDAEPESLPGGRFALAGCLHPAPLPDPSRQQPGRECLPDSSRVGLQPANRTQRHPRLQRDKGLAEALQPGSKHPHTVLIGPSLLNRLRPCGRSPPLSEGVRPREQLVDFGDGGRGCLRGGARRKADLWRDRSGDALAPSLSQVDAGETLDHLSRPTLRKKKGGATD